MENVTVYFIYGNPFYSYKVYIKDGNKFNIYVMDDHPMHKNGVNEYVSQSQHIACGGRFVWWHDLPEQVKEAIFVRVF